MKHIVCTVINDLSTDQRMHRIADTLVHAGYQVTLIGRQLPDSRPLQQRDFHQVRLSCFFHRGFPFYAEYNIRLWIWLLFHSFDIVNAVDLDTIAPGWLSARMKGKKVVYDAHEWFPYCPEIVVRPRVQAFWQTIESFFVPRMDAAYTVSRSIASSLEQAYGIPFGLVRNMPVERKMPGLEKDKYILYQGALNVGRGLEELLEAMQHLDFQLYIAGKGDIEDYLKVLITKNNIKNKVMMLGQLTPGALREVTDKAWLGVNLLQNLGWNYYYSLANKFFDYVQSGIPQITMAFPEYQVMNREYEVALLIPDLSVEAIISAVRQLADDPELYKTLSANCALASKEWSWSKEQAKLLEIYERLAR